MFYSFAQTYFMKKCSLRLTNIRNKRQICRWKHLISMIIKPSWLSGWRTGVGILCPRGKGSIPVVTSYLVWDGGQWFDSVSSGRDEPAQNELLEKPGKVSRMGVWNQRMVGPHPSVTADSVTAEKWQLTKLFWTAEIGK